VLTQGFSNEAGNAVDDSPAGKDPEWPNITTLTVTFEDLGGKTKLTIHQNAPEEVAKRTGAYQSWLQMLDNLATEVKKINLSDRNYLTKGNNSRDILL
jgi:hypothetical protein